MNSNPSTYRYIPKSFSSRDFLSASHSITTPTNNRIEFQKSSNTKQLNINGTSPIIIYKKTPKSNHRSQIEFNFIKSGEYVSDGGLKKKLDKFNGEKAIKENKSSSKIISPSNSKKLMKIQTSQSMKSIRKKNETQANKNTTKKNNERRKKENNIKRNNYFSPPPKSPNFNGKILKKNKSNKSSNKENKMKKKEIDPEEEERKYMYMNKLIENGVAGYIRNIQLEKRPTIEEEMNEKKQKVLEDNGIEINIDSLENTQDEEKKEENEININFEDEKIDEENNLNSHSSNNIFKSNRFISPQINNYLITNESENYIKKIYKPKVDQFEYLRKINEEKKKIPGYISRKLSITKSNNSNNKKKENNENSFRYSYSNDKSKSKSKRENENSKNIDFDDNFLFSSRKNLRSEEEIKSLIKEKNDMRKREEEEKKFEENKKLFNIYKNLYSLDSKTQNNLTSKSSKKGSKRKRIKNEYYVGSESNNNSTIIEANDYYMNVLESQQLLVNGGLYRIDNENLYNNQNISKEQIKKITEKENSRINTEESNNSNLNELKEKVNKTLSKSENIINNVSKSKKNSFDNNPSEKNDNNNLEIDINNNNNKNIKVNNENETTSNIYTKDKNLPSLSHTYVGTTNPNQKIVIEIEPRVVLNLIEIIKYIFRRKTFYDLLEIYINEVITQRYNVGFAFFTAIIKQYPFRKIEEYSNYKTYYLAFFQLFKPFLKKMFKYFVNCFLTKRKIEYFVEILSRLFKFKALEKIYDYSQEMDNSEEALAFKLIITRIMKLTMKPQLKEALNIFKNNCLKLPNKKSKRDYSAKAPFENNKITEEEEDLISNNNNNIIETNSSNSSLKNHRMKFNPLKMNSFIYESLNNSSKSSYTVEPNSVDNDRLHQLQLMLISKRDELEFEDYPMNTGSDNSYEKKKMKTSSNKSAKSLQEICQMKPGLNLSRSLSDLSNDQINNSIKKSISSNRSLQRSFSNKSLNDSKDKKNNSISKEFDDNGKKEKTLKEKIEEIKNNNSIKIEKEIINKENNFEVIPSILTKEEKMRIESKEDELNKNEEFKDKTIESEKEIEPKNYNIIKEENKTLEDEKDKKIKEENKTIEDEKDKKIKEDNKTIEDEKDKKIKEENKTLEDENNKGLKEEEENKIKKEENKNTEEENSFKKEDNNEKEEILNNKKEEEEEDIKLEDNIKEEIDIPEEIIEKKINRIPSQIEADISADKDNINHIDWEYSISNSKSSDKKKDNITPERTLENENDKNKKKINETNNKDSFNEEIVIEDLDIENTSKDNSKEKKEKNEDKKNETPTQKKTNNTLNKKEKEKKTDRKNSIEDYADFEDVSDIEKDDEDVINIIKNEVKLNDKSRNNLTNSPQKEEEIIMKENEEVKNLNFQIENKENFIDILTEEIINNILNSEIKSEKIKLIPKRLNKYDPFNNIQMNLSASLSNSKESPLKENLSSLSSFPLKDNSLQALNDSLMSSYSAYSIFNKTIKDQMKENSFRLYYNKIGPQLIILIKKEIKNKYKEIYDNISTPMKNQAKGLMVSLSLQDADMLRDNYKRLYLKKEISNIIDKEKILKDFIPINKKIREEDNIKYDNFEYDNMLNNCIIDSAIELINKERLYGESGDPLPWSSRTHEIQFKYDKNDPKKLCDYISRNLLYLLHNRIGLISENYDFLSGEQLNIERERRFLKNVHKELDDNEYQWKNLEMEETQLKVEVTEMIMEQLYNEIIEILEHVQYSRRRPDLYQNKSIYACEEIPKLSFQVTTTENLESENEENDLMNM